MDRISTLRAGFEEMNRGEFEAAAQRLSDDVRWIPRLASVDEGTLSGRDAVVRAWKEQSEALGGTGVFRFEARRIEELGAGAVLMEVVVRGRGAGSGAEVADAYFVVVTFRGGKIVRVDSYDDAEAALADLA